MKKINVALVSWVVALIPQFATGQSIVPATAPAIPVARPAGPTVEIFPFTPVGDVGGDGWVGRGIQESLQGDASKTAATLILFNGAGPAPVDPVAIAHQAGVNLAVVGTFQSVGGQVRANGHVVDVATGATVGGFSATGSQNDLFKVEDALGVQLARLLPSDDPRPVNAPVLEPSPVVVEQQSPPVNNNYYYPSTPYYYPESFAPVYYGYDDPFVFGFYGGVGFFPYYGYGRYYDRGYRDGGRGYEYGGNFRGSPGLRNNPGYRNPVYRGTGRSQAPVHTAGPSVSAGHSAASAFHFGGGGASHGGGGGHR